MKRTPGGIAGKDAVRHVFIPAGNEPSGYACIHIWRLPRGSNTPLLCSVVFDFGEEADNILTKS